MRLMVEGQLPCDLPLDLSSMVGYDIYLAIWLEAKEFAFLLLAGDRRCGG